MYQSVERVTAVIPEHSLLRDNLGVMRLLIAGGIVVVGLFWAVTIGLWLFQTVGSVVSVVASLIAVLALLVYLGAYYLLRRGHTLTSRRVVFFGMLLGAAFAVFLLGGPPGPWRCSSSFPSSAPACWAMAAMVCISQPGPS